MTEISRRELLLASTALLGGCATASGPALRPDEQALGPDLAIVTRGPESRILRCRARWVPKGADLSAIAERMQAAMARTQGVGLAGPQVGLLLRVAVLKLDYKTDHPRTIFVRNPLILERSDESADGYEGCLSVPGVGGLVRRNRWIHVRYDTLAGERVQAEAEGPNAVLFQHELDHLDGILYLDRLLGPLLPMDEVRRLRKEAEEKAELRSDLVPLEGLIVPARPIRLG